MDRYAPIFITTLNRYDHLKKCVVSLSACTHVDKTDLYIAFDYPLNDTHWEGYRKIEMYLSEIKGFKSVNIIKRDVNYGALSNFLAGQNEIFEKYDRMIFSEDDNEFSINFLDYINAGLCKFKDDPNIMAVCGYNYPIVIPSNFNGNYYYYKAFSAWGFGSWKTKPLKYIYNADEIVEFINNKSYIKESIKNYKFANLNYLLISIMQSAQTYGDGAITMNLLKENKYCVFPTVSKVRNHGHDGSGLHCGSTNDNKFVNQKIDCDHEFAYLKNTMLHNKNISKQIIKHFEINNVALLKFFILLLKYNLNKIWRAGIKKKTL